jgi:hypothetical protein
MTFFMEPVNPYLAPATKPSRPPSAISAASRLRRRLAAIVFVVVGAGLFLLRDFRPIAATLLGPSFVLLGFAGLLFPVAIPDPKREFGAMQLWVDTSRQGFWIGPAAMAAGIAIGAVLLFL